FCKNLKLLFDENFQIYQDSFEALLIYPDLTLPIRIICKRHLKKKR
ncbi:unnamed protein product, partial [Rotaria sp. Silwood2]